MVTKHITGLKGFVAHPFDWAKNAETVPGQWARYAILATSALIGFATIIPGLLYFIYGDKILTEEIQNMKATYKTEAVTEKGVDAHLTNEEARAIAEELDKASKNGELSDSEIDQPQTDSSTKSHREREKERQEDRSDSLFHR